MKDSDIFLAVVKDVPSGTISRKIGDDFVEEMRKYVGKCFEFYPGDLYGQGTLGYCYRRVKDRSFSFCEDWLDFSVLAIVHCYLLDNK